MKFVLNDESTSKVLKLIEMFKVIKGISNHCTMYCKKDRIHIQMMDNSHTSLMDINLSNEWFDLYEPDIVTISVDSSMIVKIMTMYAPQTVLVVHNTSKLDKLYIDLIYKTGIEKNFAIPLFDIDCDVMESELYDYSLEYSMNTKLLDKYVSELMIFSESGSISCKDDKIYMKVSGNEGLYSIKIPYDNLSSLIVEENLKMTSNINLKLLQNATKFCNVFKEINIKADPQKPMLLTFEETTTESQAEEEEENEENVKSLLSIHYFIAPKIIEDEDFNEDSDDEEGCETGPFDNLGENIVQE